MFGSSKRKDIETLEQELSALKQSNSDLSAQVNQLTATNKTLVQEIDKLKADNKTASMRAWEIVASQGVPLGTIKTEVAPEPVKTDPHRFVRTVSLK